ncbi:DUF4230 domain-containing protein [Actinocorallia sp. API 0066]|uniref:DUF4230 domain-containing protein n=1 Tax=Actinocorallia sp. API 0066 TaxID=2896846 RepID=UPI001E4F4B3C|nr:DUF4230 domain-containing protein [Actinocorallia sp. API 0066]MCD0451369.1 DUF4230 domain-containing protein [Actinocorallia sp. API 0066]
MNTKESGRSGRLLQTGAVVLVLAVLYGIASGMNWLPDWANPFGTTDRDRSGPAVLKSIKDLSRYEAATGQFQIVVDLEKDAKFLPGAIRGQRTLFVAIGSVDAYVDFSKIDQLEVSEDRTKVTITLPPAALEDAALDNDKSYVFATERGLFDRIGDFFSSNPNDQQQLYQLAETKIEDAAEASGLKERADANTRQMLENLMKALGFTEVTINGPAT